MERNQAAEGGLRQATGSRILDARFFEMPLKYIPVDRGKPQVGGNLLRRQQDDMVRTHELSFTSEVIVKGKEYEQVGG